MKLVEALNRIDTQNKNTYSQNDKVAWLSALDMMIKTQVIDTHEGAETKGFSGYDETTDLQTELLAPAPFDEMYLRWLDARIYYANGEYSRYNNAITAYQELYDGFSNFYNRTHMPKGRTFQYF